MLIGNKGFAAILMAIAAGTSGGAWAQGKNVALSADQVMKGSPAYRDVVDRFLKKMQPKIVGGDKAPAGAYPWQVSLGVSWIADPYRAHFCGGTVYAAQWIVTAAHCLDGNEPRDIIVTAGTQSLGVGGERRNVERIIVKSDYNGTTMDNDIGLLRLTEPLSLGSGIRSIPLVPPKIEGGLLKEGTDLVVTGFGHTQQGGTTVRDLQHVVVPFVDRADCNRAAAYNGGITANMICAGKMASGGVDSCQGDSGGPLTVQTGSPDTKLAGVVSWGDGCAQVNKVGVYTRAANYADWVAACIADPKSCK